MFGLVLPNEKVLSEEERKRYNGIYCGICKSLVSRYGALAKYTLNYDIVFLALVLQDAYANEPKNNSGRCITHPFKKRSFYSSEFIDYAADMNVVLTYHKLIDDWNDDKNTLAKALTKKLEKAYVEIKEREPDRCRIIEESLNELYFMEKSGQSNADTVSSAFAKTTEAVFSYKEKSEELGNLGKALGKFIYIADACIDFRKDLKKQQYNVMSFYLQKDFDNILENLMGDVHKALELIPNANSDGIVKNIIYSGIWIKYEISKGRQK